MAVSSLHNRLVCILHNIIHQDYVMISASLPAFFTVQFFQLFLVASLDTSRRASGWQSQPLLHGIVQYQLCGNDNSNMQKASHYSCQEATETSRLENR